MEFSPDKIRIGVSSCLLGQEVRYNGGHKRDRFVAQVLAEHFEYVPFCPEVAIGLGVPRPTLRLKAPAESPRAVSSDDEVGDVTDALSDYGARIGTSADYVSGYILKARSPSCGMERVKVYDDNGIPFGSSSGVYARALMAAQPLMPIEEEGRLNDPGLRDSFLERVLVYHRWQCLVHRRLDAHGLVRFHSEHKFLIMAHDQRTMRRLGRLVADAGKGDIGPTAQTYIEEAMSALARPAKPGDQANVLQHMAGFFKKILDGADRAELAESIDAYRRGQASILVPLTLIRHHLRRRPNAFLEQQRYLETRPRELNTRR